MRTRLFAELTWPEVREAAGRGAGVVLPVGSTEQHGPHLALSTDAVLPTELALAVAEAHDLLVAPAVHFGYRSRPLSGGGQGFPGTISLRAQTLIMTVEDVLRELLRQGFRRLAILNWHFENQNFVYESAWLALDDGQRADALVMVVEQPFSQLSEETMAVLFPGGFPGWDVEHASILETSLMLHLRPDLVLFDRAVDDAAARHPFYDVVPIPDDFVPASGTLWKATQASAEKGALAWKEIVTGLDAAIATDLPRSLQAGDLDRRVR
jgi:creatinine amidohydrolase